MKNWAPFWIIVGTTAFYWTESHFGSPVWEFLIRFSPLAYLMLGVDWLVGSQRWEALIQAVFHPAPRSMIGMALAWSMGCTSDTGGTFFIPYLLAGFFARQHRYWIVAAASAVLIAFFTWVNSSNTYWLFPLFGIALAMPFLFLCFVAGAKLGRVWRERRAKAPNQPLEPTRFARGSS